MNADDWTDATAGGYERTSKHRGRCVECGATGPLDTDGNPVVLHERGCPSADDAAEDEDAEDEYYAGGTPGNTTTDDHGDEVPKRTERADFGGGSSTGVEEL